MFSVFPVLIILGLISSTLFARSNFALSIGTGYIEYNPKKDQHFYSTSQTRWNQTMFYTTDTKFSFLNPYYVSKANTCGYSSPVLYFTFQALKDFALRFSYQRSAFKNKEVIPQTSIYPGSGFWTMPITVYNLSYIYTMNDYHAGFSFQFNPKNRIKIYAGFDITLFTYTSNLNYLNKMNHEDENSFQGEQVIRKDRYYGSTYFLGLQTSLCKNLLLNYECSGVISHEALYYIRPLSRLSLGFQF